MRIALLSPFEETVPPKKYGGTELVVANLANELVKAGHSVDLYASGDSRTKARLRAVFKTALRVDPHLRSMPVRDAYKFIGIGRVVTMLKDRRYDIIHNHIGWRLLPFVSVLPAPVLTTLHGPLDIPYQQAVYGTFKNANYASISMSQRRGMPTLNFVANVYNGIDLSLFRFFPKHKGYLAFLGRTSPEKGTHIAIEVAKRVGIPLRIAAKVDAVDQPYFQKMVKPHIDGKRVSFIGEIGPKKKTKFLGDAMALLAPIQWEEPFGLYFVEAMACGTPVLAMRRGSVPEIIKDGVNGFACDTPGDMRKKIPRAMKLDRRSVFDFMHVGRKFAAETMAASYLKVYERVMRGAKRQK
jgi:glycosyltransferase involved in cell wall biosynthesis